MSEQQELFQPDMIWFHFFRELIRSGKWAALSAPSAKLYPCIKSYIGTDGDAFPSISTLQTSSGLSKESVNKALKELAAVGLLEAKKTTGKVTHYQIKELFRLQDTEGVIHDKGAIADYIPKKMTEIIRAITSGHENVNVQIIINQNSGDVTINQDSRDIGSEALQKIIDAL